jgi:hypothetical protein
MTTPRAAMPRLTPLAALPSVRNRPDGGRLDEP